MRWAARFSVLAAQVVSVAVGAPAQGGGFLIAEQGAAATGRAAANTAHATDGSTIVYNPAGLTQLDGLQAYAGFNLITAKASITEIGSNRSVPTEPRTFFVPNAFVSFAVNDRLAAGVGFYSPFGLGIEWPHDAPGNDIVRKEELTTFFISPVLAADLGRWLTGLSVGAGIDIVLATVLLEQDVRFGDARGSARLSGEALGVGGRVGLLYRPPMLPQLTLGLAWRSRVELAFSGTADFDIESVPAFRSLLPPDGDVTTELTLPQSLLGGVAFDVTPWLNLEADLNWIGWSSYAASTLEFADGSRDISKRDWVDTLAVRAAAESRLGAVALRAGYAWDPTPVPTTTLDPTLPDGNRHVVSAGLGINLNDAIGVDIAGLYVVPLSRATADTPYEPRLKGTYDVSAWLVSFNLRIAISEIEAVVAAAASANAGATP